MSTSITTPSRVKVSGGSSPGVICASGVANQKNNENPDDVKGKIVGIGGALPTSPPTGSIQGAFFSGRSWRISQLQHGDIPDAQCGASSSPVNNRLAIWTHYPTGGWDVDEVTFGGVCAGGTDCDVMATPATLAAVPAEAPQEMQINASGFSGPVAEAFNGVWLLKTAKGARCTWDNGRRKGKNEPRIELRLDLQEPNLWHLTFKRGRGKLAYYQSNLNWTWSRPNEMLFAGGNAARKGAPLTVRVSAVG